MTDTTLSPMPNLPNWAESVSAVLVDGIYCHDRRGEAQIFSFGGNTSILYFAENDDLSDGLEECAAWLREHEPWHFSDPEYPETDDRGGCMVQLEGVDGMSWGECFADLIEEADSLLGNGEPQA